MLQTIKFYLAYKLTKPKASLYRFVVDTYGDKSALVLIKTAERFGFYNAITNQTK
jgi:hypothetical protein